MGETTGIGYCDSTINPLMGCNGCELWNPKAGVERCYAGRESRRRAGNKGWPARFGEPEFFPGRIEQAIKWPNLTGKDRPEKPWLNGYPRLIFVNDLGDTFTEGKDPMEWLYPLVFKMAEAPHVWMFLTKRPRRMVEFFKRVGHVPRNFWLGTTVTSRQTASRAHELLAIGEIDPHAMLWLSLEPLRGPIEFNTPDVLSSIDLPNVYCLHCDEGIDAADCTCTDPKIGWVALGGESGPNTDPMHPDRPRKARDACQAAGVPFFFKQWGEFIPRQQITFSLTKQTEWGTLGGDGKYWQWTTPWNGNEGREPDNEYVVYKVGRKLAGRMLDGREWSEMPRISPSLEPVDPRLGRFSCVVTDAEGKPINKPKYLLPGL